MGRQVAPQPSFQDALLQPAKGGPDITAKELWANKPVVFLLIRRPGCVMCRCVAPLRALAGQRAAHTSGLVQGGGQEVLEPAGQHRGCRLHAGVPGEDAASSSMLHSPDKP